VPPATPTGARLAAGNNHTCALTATNGVKCWGLNQFGQLGNGTTTNSLTPVNVTGLTSGVASIVAGDAQTCALTTSGAMKCWGNNANGQLGNGTTTQATTPTDVTGLTSGVASIATGDNHSCAALTNGTIRCWGWGTSGQLGQGALTSSLTPVTVTGTPAGTTVTSISAGYRHTCATFSNGAALCWGRGDSGQIGNGTFDARISTPTQPTGMGSGVTDIVAGGAHTCAVQNNTVKCWGLNNAGPLGNGTAGTNSNTPVTATGITNATAVAAGGNHTCALLSTGTLRCWGLNQEGELGIGLPDVNNITTPADVPGLTGQTELFAGVQHTCSRTTTTIRCWGLNTYGQLGNGNTTRQFSPTTVTNF
jgi:alpha-tubulin suppressor-like RCC1 family protein